MAILIITPEAQSDIERFYYFYLETASEKIAFALVDTITNKLTELAKNPKIGRKYYDTNTEFSYRGFLIFFGAAKRNCYIALLRIKMLVKAVIVLCR